MSFIKREIEKYKRNRKIKDYFERSSKTDSALPCPICGGYYPGDCGGPQGVCCMLPKRCNGCRDAEHTWFNPPEEEWN